MATSETKEIPKPIPTLKELLVTSIISPTVSLPDGIKKIDLGSIGREAEGLLKRSFQDSNGLERGRLLLVSPNGEVKISTKDNIGSSNENGQEICIQLPVQTIFSSQNLPRLQRQTYYLGGFVHSHGIFDLPISPQDLSHLFRNVDSPTIAPMIMVITPQLKSIYFRGKDTPQWDDNFISKKVFHWNNLIESNVKNKIKYGMSKNEQIGINGQVIHKFIRAVKDKYDLRLYSCLVNSNIAVEESA